VVVAEGLNEVGGLNGWLLEVDTAVDVTLLSVILLLVMMKASKINAALAYSVLRLSYSIKN
jgi:hypothetical protein